MRKNKTIKLILLLLNLVILLRLIDICVLQSNKYHTLYEDRKETLVLSNYPPRGRILDCKGRILVDNKGVKVLIFNSLSGVNKNTQLELIDKISNVIELDIDDVTKNMLREYFLITNKEIVNGRMSDEIKEKYKNRQISTKEYEETKLNSITKEEIEATDKEKAKLFYLMGKGYNYQDKVIKSNITDEELTAINELNLPGFRIEIKWERVYPYDTTLNALFGSVGSIPKEEKEEYLKNGYSLEDMVGVSFLEKYYEPYLKGTKGVYHIEDDGHLSKIKDDIKGNDLILSLDIEKQMAIEEILKKEIKNAKKYPSAKFYQGSYIVVSDPLNGGILALVAMKVSDKTFTSDVIGFLTNSYTVGSVVKGASHTVAYMNGVLNEKTKMVDSCVKLFSQGEKCSWKRLGTLNDIDALTYSSNYFQFVNAIKVSGKKYTYNMKFNATEEDFDKYRSVFTSYGLGSKTGIDIYEEKLGIKGSLKTGDLLLNLSIGQYDTYTPLMLNNYIATIANGGSRYKMRLVSYMVNEKGEQIEINPPTILNKVGLDSKYMNRIRTGMHNVVLKGTASGYFNKSVDAAGKTGTSETFYNGVKTNTKSFVAFLPYDKPEYALTIISPHISAKIGGSSYAYPINSRLSRQIAEILFEN